MQNSLLRSNPPTGSALEAGYATAGTDTGHQGSVTDASWALDNDTAERNFADRAIHVVTDVSVQITERHYGRVVEYSYFMGCSRGGGQAMIASQRYPDDYDGIVAGAPAFSWPALGAGQMHTQQAMYPDPGQLTTPVVTADNRALLQQEILAACDALCVRVHGHDRHGELVDAVTEGTATVVEQEGRVVGYASSVGFLGHAVAEHDDALKALIGAAPSFFGPGFILPTGNGDVLRWCLSHGLRVVQPLTLMTIGEYQEPAGPYMPSILY